MMKLRTDDRVTVAELAQCVEALEAEIAGLKQLLSQSTAKPCEPSAVEQPFKHDWEETFGIFKDDPTFDEAVRLGREWRKRMNRRPEWKGTRQRRATKAND